MNYIAKLPLDLIWYAGVITAVTASMVAHAHPSTPLIILGLHIIKETLDWQHRLNHNRLLQAIDRRLLALGG